MDLNHPLIQSVLLPLLLAFALTAVVRGALGNLWGPRLASLAIGGALWLVTVLILGLSLPPHSALQKLPFLLMGSLLLGFALDRWPSGRGLPVLMALLWPLLVFLWLAANWMLVPRPGVLLAVGFLYGYALLVFWRLDRVRRRTDMAGAMLFGAALGLGGVALVSASLALGQLAFALATAVGGFMLWNWPKARDEFGLVGVFGAGGAWLILLGLVLLLTDAPPMALALLGLVFFADALSERLPPRGGSLGRVLRPVYLVVIAVIPIVLALFISTLGGEDEDSPYYSLRSPEWLNRPG